MPAVPSNLSSKIPEAGNIGALLSGPLTKEHIGKAVIVLDHSDLDTAKKIKHKFIEISFSEESSADFNIDIESKDNRGFSAENKLVFYVEENHEVFFNERYFPQFLEAYEKRELASGHAGLAHLGNELIEKLKQLRDKETGKPLSLQIYPDVDSAQYAYQRVRGTIGLRPETLLDKEQVAGAEDLTLNNLREWLVSNENIYKDIYKDMVPRLRDSIDTLDSQFQSRTDLSADLSAEAKEAVNFIVFTISLGFKALIKESELTEKYKGALGNYIDATLGEVDAEGRFKGIKQLVDTIINKVPTFIFDYRKANTEFYAKCVVFNEYLVLINNLFNSLVQGINFDTEKEALRLEINAWAESLKAFMPILDRGVQSQEVLSNKIDEFKQKIDEKCGQLEAKNNTILKQMLQKAVEALKGLAGDLQVEEGSEIEKNKFLLVAAIANLLKAIDKVPLRKVEEAHQNLKKFQAQYDNLSGKLASLRQALDRLTFCNNALHSTTSKIKKKVLKLKKGNATADKKAELLLKIEAKITAIHDNIAAGKSSDLKLYVEEAKTIIRENEASIASYRSQWGSSFFFGKILRMDLESRVTSKHLMNALSSQLDTLSSQLEDPSMLPFSL